MTDALVHVVFANGNSWTARLTPSEPSAVIPARKAPGPCSLTYVRHGIEHIAFGFDHLLFVAGADADRARLAQAGESDHRLHGRAFDHLDLRDAWLGDAAVGAGRGDDRDQHRPGRRGSRAHGARAAQPCDHRPWIVAFAFGLLHGFGFAGALVELGLPQGDIPLALLAFNVGVELGQLAFIAVLLSAVYAVRRFVAIPAAGDRRLGLRDRHRRGILERPAAGRDVSR